MYHTPLSQLSGQNYKGTIYIRQKLLNRDRVNITRIEYRLLREKFKLKVCFNFIIFKYDDSGGINCIGNDLKNDFQKSAKYHTSALHQLAELAEIKQLQVANTV